MTFLKKKEAARLAKHRGRSVIKVNVANLTAKECNILLNALRSGRLTVTVENP